jgi:ABC-2 type transport system ATP-binding protein
MQQEFLELLREARIGGQTVFMSSHVLAEVQHAADRVGIVRDGRLVAVERVESLGKRAKRHVEIHFDGPVPPEAFEGLPGLSELQVDGAILRCVVDGMLDPLVKAAAKFTVADMISTEPDLEETFLSYYYAQEGESRAA